ncbi:Hypothetical predicted protein, partial [Drosophila guanche]
MQEATSSSSGYALSYTDWMAEPRRGFSLDSLPSEHQEQQLHSHYPDHGLSLSLPLHQQQPALPALQHQQQQQQQQLPAHSPGAVTESYPIYSYYRQQSHEAAKETNNNNNDHHGSELLW